MNIADNDINGATALEGFSINKYYAIIEKIINDNKKIKDNSDEKDFF